MNERRAQNRGLTAFNDTVFMVSGEMVPNNGEDSFAYSINDRFGFIGVFDGCGGIGSRKYEVYDNKSGAYLASHTCAEEFYLWFNDFCQEEGELSGNTIKKISEDIYQRLTECLKKLESGAGASTIKGSLTKSFPTTASTVLFTNVGETLYSAFLWAGDSRGFVLTEDGLCQITVDDIEGEEDALSNLTSDGKLSNVISALGDYKLNSKLITCEGAAVLVTATDGCFGYFSTPMEFEYMLLSTLSVSQSIMQWKEKIEEYIRKYAGDDYTIGIAAFGYESFKRMKKAYFNRKKILYKDFISQLKNASEKKKISLWNEYKKGYYRGE